MRSWVRRHLPWLQRRWISDSAKRNDHEALVRERLKTRSAELTSPEQEQRSGVAPAPGRSSGEEIDLEHR